MFRVVYEVMLRGLPEELECLSRLNSILNSKGVCVGSHTMFVCSYRDNVIIKVTPHTLRSTQGVQPYRDVLQPLSISIVIEGNGAGEVIDAANTVHDTLKGCGLSIRLLAD